MLYSNLIRLFSPKNGSTTRKHVHDQDNAFLYQHLKLYFSCRLLKDEFNMILTYIPFLLPLQRCGLPSSNCLTWRGCIYTPCLSLSSHDELCSLVSVVHLHYLDNYIPPFSFTNYNLFFLTNPVVLGKKYFNIKYIACSLSCKSNRLKYN